MPREPRSSLITCPECGGATMVISNKALGNHNIGRRRRVCIECDARVTTYESIDMPMEARAQVRAVTPRDQIIKQFLVFLDKIEIG